MDVSVAELRAMVAPVLGRTTAELGEVRVEQLTRPAVPGLATVGIWRVVAGDRSVVLKVLRHADGGNAQWRSHEDPGHGFYWRREALAFRSDLFAELAASTDAIRPPTCHAVVERPDGSVAIWMEDVSGHLASEWTPARYGVAARHLGRLQGRLAGTSALDEPWLSRNWLRTYLDRREPGGAILDDDAAWRHPLVRAVLPTERAAEFRRLWLERNRLLTLLESYPQTLCHLDFHPRNLFDVGGRTVVIDWAFSGVGSFGEDAGTVVVDTVADFHLPVEALPALFDLVVQGYAAGLADAGSPLGEDDVRRAVAAGAAARYGWLVPGILSTAVAGRTTLNGRPVEEGAAAWAGVGTFLLELASVVRESI